MTFTLSQLSYRVARELGVAQEGVATGGSTTTVVDTTLRTENDDYWNKGSVWILRDAAGAGAAPEGESSVVTDFVSGTSTITVSPAFTVAVASGDRYAVANDRVPLRIIEQAINEALQDMGKITVVDTSSLTIAANQTEYTLPTAAHDLKQVWIQSITTDANDNQWQEILNWQIQPAAVGSAATLILPYQYPTAYDLKLVYVSNHSELLVGTGQLSEFVPVERVVFPAILKCLQYRKLRTGWRDWDQQIAAWEAKAEQAKASLPVLRARKPGRLLIIADTDDIEYVNEVNRVYL